MHHDQPTPGSRSNRHRLLRRGAIGCACAVLIAVGLATYADDKPATAPAPATPVTSARPPREAVPTAALTPAQQAHVRQCRENAKSRGLHGPDLEKYLRDCITTRHMMTPAPSTTTSR